MAKRSQRPINIFSVQQFQNPVDQPHGSNGIGDRLLTNGNAGTLVVSRCDGIGGISSAESGAGRSTESGAGRLAESGAGRSTTGFIVVSTCFVSLFGVGQVILMAGISMIVVLWAEVRALSF